MNLNLNLLKPLEGLEGCSARKGISSGDPATNYFGGWPALTRLREENMSISTILPPTAPRHRSRKKLTEYGYTAKLSPVQIDVSNWFPKI